MNKSFDLEEVLSNLEKTLNAKPLNKSAKLGDTLFNNSSKIFTEVDIKPELSKQASSFLDSKILDEAHPDGSFPITDISDKNVKMHSLKDRHEEMMNVATKIVQKKANAVLNQIKEFEKVAGLGKYNLNTLNSIKIDLLKLAFDQEKYNKQLGVVSSTITMFMELSSKLPNDGGKKKGEEILSVLEPYHIGLIREANAGRKERVKDYSQSLVTYITNILENAKKTQDEGSQFILDKAESYLLTLRGACSDLIQIIDGSETAEAAPAPAASNKSELSSKDANGKMLALQKKINERITQYNSERVSKIPLIKETGELNTNETWNFVHQRLKYKPGIDYKDFKGLMLRLQTEEWDNNLATPEETALSVKPQARVKSETVSSNSRTVPQVAPGRAKPSI